MRRFTVTFEVEDEAPPPAIFCDAWKAVWAKGDAHMIGGAAVISVTTPVPSDLDTGGDNRALPLTIAAT